MIQLCFNVDPFFLLSLFFPKGWRLSLGKAPTVEKKKQRKSGSFPRCGRLPLLRPAAVSGKDTRQWPVFFQKRAAFPPLRVGGFPDLREPLLRGVGPPPFRLPRRSNAPCRSPGADCPHLREPLFRVAPPSSRLRRDGRSSAPVGHPARTSYLLRASGHCAPPPALERQGGGGWIREDALELRAALLSTRQQRRLPRFFFMFRSPTGRTATR